MMKKNLKFTLLTLSALFLFVFVFLSSFVKADPCGYCTLEIYVEDEYDDPLDSDIYLDGSFENYNDHLTIEVDYGTHTVEARKSGYQSDSEDVYCPDGDTKTVYLTLYRSDEDVRVDLDDFKVDPDYVCMDEDGDIELSVEVTLDTGPDDTKIKAKFYVEDEDGDWEFIDDQVKYLDEGDTETFSVFYDYYAHDREEGIYDVKVVVQNGDDEEVAYSKIHVDECVSERRVDVGSIILYPDYPNMGDIISGKVLVSLESARLPATVYVDGYIDGNKFYSDDFKMYRLETETIYFTINTNEYSSGTHTIKIEVNVDGYRDSSYRTFSIEPFLYAELQRHCLFVDKVWTDEPLQPGEKARVHVRISSCGDVVEPGVRVNLLAFSESYYDGTFDIPIGDSKDIVFTVSVPNDAEGKTTFDVRTWNAHTADTWTKDFIVYTGMPFIDLRHEFVIGQCENNKISFDVINMGKVSDTFSLIVTGPAADWVTGIPEEIILEAGEKKTIIAYVNVPCYAELGFHEFTVTAEGSPKYSVTSKINVVKHWVWPKFEFPSGLFFGFLGVFSWLPWFLIILLILFLLILLIAYGTNINSRRRPMFDCMTSHGC